MRTFDVIELAKWCQRHEDVSRLVWVACNGGQRDDIPIDNFIDTFLVPMLQQLRGLAFKHGFEHALARIGDNGPLNIEARCMSYERISHELEFLRQSVMTDLEFHVFVHVPADTFKRVEETKPRWIPIFHELAEITFDVNEARLCLCVDLYTACIFHLMRVVELGMYALAEDINVPQSHRPLRWEEWQPILQKIKDRSETIAQGSAGPRRDAELEFYRGALGQFYAFKDSFRNYVMHGGKGKEYNEADAMSVFSHVQEFMSLIANRLHTNKLVKQAP